MDTASLGGDDQPQNAPDRTRPSRIEGAIGDQIGPYKLLEAIGEGGFGSVFLAEQTQPVSRRVAIKLLKPGMDSQSVIARFETERQVLALMDHPGIATVLDAGRTALGRPYFVMEYVKGKQITTFCDEGSLGIRDRVDLMRKVCKAVQHAHQKGIIHRDLKPSNVLVTRSDGQALPKVIDFGIAKAMTPSTSGSAAYTGMHQLLGTPAYMSPEQAGGAAHAVDTRADIYSLGAMLYELFTGSTPIRSQEFKELSIPEMHSRIAEDAITALAERLKEDAADQPGVVKARSSVLSQLRSDLRGDLNWIVLKCLEKDPARRYETVAALEADLARYLSHEAVLAGPPSKAYRIKKFVRRRRVEVAAAGAVLAALVLGFVGTAVGWARASEESSRLRFTLDFFNSTLAGVTSESSAVPLWNDDPSLTLGDALARSESLIGTEFETEPMLEATIRQLVGLAQLRGGEFSNAALQLSRAYELRSVGLGSQHERTLELLLPIAEARSKSGDIEGGFESAMAAYTRYAQAFGEDAQQTRAVALWNGRWFSSGFRFAQAEDYFDRAVLAVAGTPDLHDPITLAALVERAGALASEGKLAQAEADLREAKPRIEQLDSGSEQIRTLFVRQFGQVLTLSGNPQEAIELLELRRDENDLAVDRVRARLLAWSLGHAGRESESVALFEDLLQLEREQPGPAFREIFLRLYFADVLNRFGRFEEAAEHAVAAIEQYDANEFPNDPDRLWGRLLEARALIQLGETERAASALAESDELAALFPEYLLRLPELRYAQARIAFQSGDAHRSEELVNEAIQMGRGVFGDEHWLVVQMRDWRDESVTAVDAG